MKNNFKYEYLWIKKIVLLCKKSDRRSVRREMFERNPKFEKFSVAYLDISDCKQITKNNLEYLKGIYSIEILMLL